MFEPGRAADRTKCVNNARNTRKRKIEKQETRKRKIKKQETQEIGRSRRNE